MRQSPRAVLMGCQPFTLVDEVLFQMVEVRLISSSLGPCGVEVSRQPVGIAVDCFAHASPSARRTVQIGHIMRRSSRCPFFCTWVSAAQKVRSQCRNVTLCLLARCAALRFAALYMRTFGPGASHQHALANLHTVRDNKITSLIHGGTEISNVIGY